MDKSLEDHIKQLKAIPDLAKVIQPLVDEIIRLQQRITDLEDQLSKNSRNSSKPPSSDGYKRVVKNNRVHSGKKQGSQKGHKGSGLKFSNFPDETISIPVQGICSCGHDLSLEAVKYWDSRQCYDLPPMQLKVTQYQIAVKVCSCCGQEHQGKSPVEGRVSYGEGVQSLASYLNIYQFLPYDRIQEFFKDVFSQSVSDGFLQNCNEQHYVALQQSEQNIKQALLKSKWLAADETSMRCKGHNHWIHTAGNQAFTFYHPDTKRGQQAIKRAGLITQYKGVVSHDRYSSYDQFEFTHQLCGVHLLRELKFLFEERNCKWAQKLYDSFLWANTVKQTGEITRKDIRFFSKVYDQITELADVATPRHQPKKKARGKPKQSPERNLLDTLIKRKKDILRFLEHEYVPFDNNQAERDLRMIKVKQKISGCFRSLHGLDVLCRIRGYISSVKKQKLPVLNALTIALRGKPNFA